MPPEGQSSTPPMAILGGKKLSPVPMNMVRPRFPHLKAFGGEFDTSLQKGMVTNHGPHVQAFEESLSRYTGVPTITAVNGQTAIMLMLRAAGVREGEVIVPAFTFGATAHAVKWVGAEPVFADSHSETLTLDPAEVERHITGRTVAVLAVDVYGIPCDYPAFERLKDRHGLRILYDSAPSFGAKFGRNNLGRFGSAQAFSFHATKSFSTMEGGALASDDTDLIETARALRNFGQIAGADCDEAGVNGKMMEVCGLIGMQSLPALDAVMSHRSEIAARYTAQLAAIPGLKVARAPVEAEPAWLYFPVCVDEAQFGLGRDAVADVLAHENLHVRKYYELPCHHMAAYREQRDLRLPVAELWGYNTISLPIYNDMTFEECDLFVEGLRRAHAYSGEIRKLKGL